MEQLPRYVLHEQLGAGGMGVVHLGTWISPAGERRVAIKQLASRGGIDDKGRARLIAEARLVFRLTHTNVCQVLDLGENERGTFVVMEFVPGLDLRALLDQLRRGGQRLDVASAVYIAREVARALDYAHRRTDDRGRALALVHGDVTPQNILLSDEGEVKLTDFGIARALGTAAPGAGLMAGTPGYVAPELRAGGGDHRSDIYGLGVTLLVALTGEAPADALARLDDPAGLRADVSPALLAIARRAVARNHEARHLSAGELERELSLELARRFAGFTPSELAAVVRAHRRRDSAGRQEAGGERGETLTSLTATDALPLHVDSAAVPPSAPSPPRGRTETADAAAPIAGRRARWALAAAVGLAAITAGVQLWHGRATRHPLAAATSPTSATTPPSAGPPGPTELPAPRPPVDLPAPATLPRVRATAASPAPVAAGASPHASAREPAHHPAAAPGNAWLTVNATPWGAVLVDGKQVAAETPLYRYRVAPGPHVVRIRFAGGGLSRPEHVRLAGGETTTLGFSP